MGANDFNHDFGCTPMEYRGQIDSLIGALGLIDSPTDLFGPHVIRLATQFIYDAQQKPSRREIAAMAMQMFLQQTKLLFLGPEFHDREVSAIASVSVKMADALIERLNADSAEGANNGK